MKSATQHKLVRITAAGPIKICAGIVVLLFSVNNLSAQNLLRYVQPLSGTAPATTISAIKHSEAGGTETNANTIPAVTLPFAMT